MLHLPNIPFWEIDLGILGLLLSAVLLIHAYRFLKSELRDNSTRVFPKTLNVTFKTTRVEKTVSLSLGPRLLTVPSIREEEPEFSDRIVCPSCGAAIPVLSMDTPIIGRYTCLSCGNDVLMEGDNPQT